MQMNRCGALATLLMLFCLAGCQQPSKKASPASQEKQTKVLAKVNGVPISELDVAFKMNKTHGMASADQPQRSLEDVIKEELLYQKGIQLGLDKDPGYQAQVEKLERQLANMKRMEMTRRVFNSQIAANVNIGAAEVKSYYDKNLDKISQELHLGTLSFSTKEAAEEVLKKVRGGATFESVAAALPASAGAPKMPGGPKPWDMGYMPWDQIPIDFVDTVYALKIGELSKVVSMKGTGFYIFKLYESRRNPAADYAGMAGLITNRLREQRIAAEFKKFDEQLRQEAKIERF
jgi:peptidyl-prolyl cis-trans isomerase C